MTLMLDLRGREHLIEHPRRVSELQKRGWLITDEFETRRIQEAYSDLARARARQAVATM
jgi:hypothetical protein